tara:strand:- start:173 stop:403 length:231 start_codon:yes stop_codon:yes gene_type:complete
VVKVPRVQLVQLVLQECREFKEQLARQEQLAFKAFKARLEAQAQLGFLEVKVPRAVLGQQAFLGLMAAQAQQVRLA